MDGPRTASGLNTYRGTALGGFGEGDRGDEGKGADEGSGGSPGGAL